MNCFNKQRGVDRERWGAAQERQGPPARQPSDWPRAGNQTPSTGHLPTQHYRPQCKQDKARMRRLIQ